MIWSTDIGGTDWSRAWQLSHACKACRQKSQPPATLTRYYLAHGCPSSRAPGERWASLAPMERRLRYLPVLGLRRRATPGGKKVLPVERAAVDVALVGGGRLVGCIVEIAVEHAHAVMRLIREQAEGCIPGCADVGIAVAEAGYVGNRCACRHQSRNRGHARRIGAGLRIGRDEHDRHRQPKRGTNEEEHDPVPSKTDAVAVFRVLFCQ